MRKNYIREYYKKITTGKIKASKKVIKQYEWLVKELDNPKLLGNNWKFDIDKANEVNKKITYESMMTNNIDDIKAEIVG